MTRIRLVPELAFVKVSAAQEGHAIEDVFLEPFQPEINYRRNVKGEQLRNDKAADDHETERASG